MSDWFVDPITRAPLARQGDVYVGNGGERYAVENGVVRMLRHIDPDLARELEAQHHAVSWYKDTELLMPRYEPDTSLDASKNYMDLKFAASEALPEGVHFKLIEAVAEHVCDTLFVQDERVEEVCVKIVKLALSVGNETIGITLTRERR